jgi:PhoPQ-activated pathogenicity-related protein
MIGASKRGWTTWLVGAVDPVRVKGIVPIVLDAINFVAVEHHEWRYKYLFILFFKSFLLIIFIN